MDEFVDGKKAGRIPLIIGGILLAVDAFGLDLALSPNYPVGVLYALVVVLGLWWTDRTYIIVAAIVGSVLCLLGSYFSVASDPLWLEIANRGIAIFVIWLVATLCFFHKKEKIETLALRKLTDRIGQEQSAMENALKESRETLKDLEKQTHEKSHELKNENREKKQDMERNTARLQLKILEKEALLDQMEVEFVKVHQTLKEQESRLVALAQGQGKGEEEFDRLQESLNRLMEDKAITEEGLKGKDARIERAEEDRNRTAGALWEKEQRLSDVLDDLSLLENNLQNKMATIDQMEEALEHAREQLREKDDRLRTMETRFNKTLQDLEEKERFLESFETKMRTLKNQSERAQITLGDREELLEKIEQQIHESLGERPKDLQKSPEPETRHFSPDMDSEHKIEEQNGKNPPPEKAFDNKDNEKVKNRFHRYTRELERSNEDLREFASIASHDLQEPIRKIIGFGIRLKKDCSPFLDDKGKDYLERMERSAQKMQKFVHELLQYSKLTASPTRHHPVDLKDVISQVLTVLESRIEETRSKIEIGSMPVIESDRMQMVQLFQNLISNAIKFHKKNEAPVIRIRHRLLENGFHEIRVQDQGIGFDEKHADRIFKPFERLHGKNEYEGTGMGLAICQKIVQRHGGKLTAQSSPQDGTTFIVTLPREDEI
jgi:anti-sigma regulatory factor (Ser/Thr protein kinase)